MSGLLSRCRRVFDLSLNRAGTYTSVANAAFCLYCTPGKYQDQRRRSNCKSCSAGKVSSAPGATTCSSCSEGTFQDSEAESTCKPVTTCFPGEMIALNRTATSDRSCEMCKTGGNIHVVLLAADIVTLGRYSSTINSPYCKQIQDCEAGKYVNESGTPSSDRLCSMCGIGGVVVSFHGFIEMKENTLQTSMRRRAMIVWTERTRTFPTQWHALSGPTVFLAIMLWIRAAQHLIERAHFALMVCVLTLLMPC